MPLQAFSFPLPETRFFKAGSFIYKFKIRGGSSYSGEEVMSGNCFNQELEEIIRTVLCNLDSLQPFTSAHFNVFPYKKRWEGMSKVMCKHHDRNLRAYPFILILYLEDNGKHPEEKLSPEKEVACETPSVSEPQPKRHKKYSPLEEAILKDLMKDLEAEKEVSVVSRRHLGSLHTGEEVQEDPGCADKKGTKEFEEPQQKSDVNTVIGRGTPGEVHPGTMQDMGEEDGDEEGENADSVSESPEKSGILIQVARNIFPFSLFFRKT